MLSEQKNAGIPAVTGMPAKQNRQRSETEEVPWLRYSLIWEPYLPAAP
jgi:hypothetical protein